MKLKITACFLCLFLQANALHLVNENVNLYLTTNDDAIALTLELEDGIPRMTGFIGKGRTTELPEDCDGTSSCLIESDDAVLSINAIDNGFYIEWKTNNTEAVFQDCLQLNASAMRWFGGPEKWQADWPVETSTFNNRVYTTIKSDNGAVSERYWLNSKGSYVFVGDWTPLYLDQNHVAVDSICFTASITGPYIGRNNLKLEYYLVALENAKEAQLHAVNNFFGKPRGHPNEWIIRNPIWTTWAKYKKAISDEVVVEFATDIANHNFTGQIEIDDYWETCYGSLTFNSEQFPNINETVQSLKDLGFTVTLWTHPFVNHDCEGPRTYGQDNDYFVKSRLDGSDETSWWDGNPAHHIDFTKEGARNWYTDRLKLLQELHGIDSFKFDAGESDYAPQNPVLEIDIELSPNSLTKSYITTVATFGDLIEVRSAWSTQHLPVFLRMLDKDSRWGLNNGLHSLITSLLQLNIVGYVNILPDMIGGNGYTEQPTAELLARWTQANTFMPSMQFSYLPWEVTSDEFDGLAIISKFVALHAEYADNILAAMNNSITNGTPVNPPVWWVDPTNEDALKVNDEYLLGEEILVAPVIEQGATTRNVFLPTGVWKDGNTGTLYQGPLTLKDYPAPIDVLPFFILQ